MTATAAHLPPLLRMSGEGAVLILLVLVAQWVCGSRLGPRWRHALWLLVLLRLALPWTVSSPTSLFNFFTASARVSAVESEVAPVQARAIVAGPVTSMAVAAPRRSARWAAGIWTAGTMVLAGGCWLNLFRFHRRIGRRWPLTDGPTLALLAECQALMGVVTQVTLMETAGIQSPLVFGCRRPRLLLPQGLAARLTRDELRHVFLHELAHVKRCDILIGWLTLGVQILHWFNPLVWLAFRRLRAESELACDALVLSRLRAGENQSYGLTIVKLLDGFDQPVCGPGLAGILEAKHQMKERIRMIAKFHNHNGGIGLAACLMAGLIVTTLTEAQTSGNNASSRQAAAQRVADLPDAAQGVWVVRFSPTGDFWPKTPGDLLDRAHQSGAHSGAKGEIGYFRTKDEGGKLTGSFLAADPEALRAALGSVPGLQVTGVEKLTQTGIESYAELPQESLVDLTELDASKGIWTVRFEPSGDFSPKTPGDLLERVNRSGAYSGTKGQIGYFRTKNEGGKLTGSFLAYDADQLKAALESVPGVRVTGVEKLTQSDIEDYKALSQESLVQIEAPDAAKGVWAVTFQPVDGFAPKTLMELLDRANQSGACSGAKGEIGYFRTKREGDRLTGSFLAYDPDPLKAALNSVPGLQVTAVDKLTAAQLTAYINTPQEQ